MIIIQIITILILYVQPPLSMEFPEAIVDSGDNFDEGRYTLDEEDNLQLPVPLSASSDLTTARKRSVPL